MSKFALITFSILSLASASFAAGLVGVNYSSPSAGLGVAGGKTTSTNYRGLGNAGGSPIGKTTGANYSGNAGGIAIVGAIAAAVGDPVISNFKIDGKTIVNNDFIKSSGALTALVTDETSINTVLSSVEVDGTYTAFAALTGTSTYDASSGSLTYAFSSLADGSHTIGISAVDGGGNTTTVQYTVKVDSGALQATAVFMYPNPFNPNSGTGKIAYRLNNDAATSIYIFNAVGRLIYRQNYASGSEGARVGYNEVDWNGVSNFGSLVANDIYFLRVVSNGKVIGKCKIAVIK